MRKIIAAFGFILVLNCHFNLSHALRLDQKLQETVAFAVEQYSRVLIEDPTGKDLYPHQGSPNSPSWDDLTAPSFWTAGFVAGVYWELFRLTNDDKWSQAAMQAQEGVRWRQNDNGTHDVGFVIMSSFGLGFTSGFGHGNDQEDWQSVIVQAARSLSTRFVENVGTLRSWNNAAWNGGMEGECLVIVDNMLNLDLLYSASELSGDQSFSDIATAHALTTMKNHFRPNWSTFHVVAYNESNGEVARKFQHQGWLTNSTWARGQAWSILGFAESYRWTTRPEFLTASENAAAFFVDHLPEDFVPFWDFDAGELSESLYQPRDTSAGAIVSLGLLNLYELTKKDIYLAQSEAIVESLIDNYNAREVQIPAISINGTVNVNQQMQDTAIIYGDFYLLKYIDKYLTLTRQ